MLCFNQKLFRIVCANSSLLIVHLLLAFAICASASAAGQEISLGWNPSADTNVAGYAVYYGPKSGNYTNRIDVGTNTTAVITGLNLGAQYYFAVTAYNSTGLESPTSNEVLFSTVVRLQLAMNPNPATGATLNFNAFSGHSYSVQGSPDLRNWTTLWKSSILTNNSSLSYTDVLTGSLTKRFYRIVAN